MLGVSIPLLVIWMRRKTNIEVVEMEIRIKKQNRNPCSKTKGLLIAHESIAVFTGKKLSRIKA